MAQSRTTIGSRINAAIQAARQGIDIVKKSWEYISGALGLLMYSQLSAWRYGVGSGIKTSFTCGLALFGVLFAIKPVRSVTTLAAALVGNPAATMRPDFFNAAERVFCLPLRETVPNSVAKLTVDYASHRL